MISLAPTMPGLLGRGLVVHRHRGHHDGVCQVQQRWCAVSASPASTLSVSLSLQSFGLSLFDLVRGDEVVSLIDCDVHGSSSRFPLPDH